MPLTEVKRIQTSDGKLFEGKIEALKHEFGIEVKALIRKSRPESGAITTDETAQILAENWDKFQELGTKYKRQISANNKGKKDKFKPLAREFMPPGVTN